MRRSLIVITLAVVGLAARAAFAAPTVLSRVGSVEGMGYLAPRDGTAVKGAAFGEAPSDAETPVDWRRGVLGTEATERHGHLPQ